MCWKLSLDTKDGEVGGLTGYVVDLLCCLVLLLRFFSVFVLYWKDLRGLRVGCLKI